jgi:hypothetical protein
MPLLTYFATIGGVLTTLLLLVDLMFGPSKPERASQPESSTQAVTTAETGLPKLRTTTGYVPSTVGLSPTAPAAEAQRYLAETTGSSPQPASQPASGGAAERKSIATVKSRSGRKAATAGRAYRESAYSSYAQQPQNWRSSAEGTLGPH